MVALNLLVKPLAIFGIDATVQNRVGTAEYGLYFSLLNLSFLFNIFLDLGINNFTTKNIAQYPAVISNYWGRIVGLRLLLFIFYAVITATVALTAGYSGEALAMLSVLVFNQLLVTFIAYIRSHFGGLHLFATDSIISILDRLLLILICGTVLFTDVTNGVFKIEWFIWIQTACYALTLLIAFGLLIRQTGIPSIRFDKAFSLVILRKSFPYALLVLLMMIYTRTDSVMLERIHPNGAYEAGIYAQGFRLLDALFMFGMIFASLLLPMFSRMLATKSNELPGLLNSSRNLLVGGALLVGFICDSHAEWILSLIYSENIAESIISFRILVWVFTAMSVSLIYGTLLTASGNLRALNRIAVVGVVLNIGLNIYLIPIQGAAGAAIATLITQSLTAIAQIIVAHRTMLNGFPLKMILATGAFSVSMFALSFYLQENYYLLLIQFFGGLLLLFTFRLIDLKAIFSLLKSSK